LQNAKDEDDIVRKKTINISGLHPNTTIKGIILKKVNGSKVIRIDNNNCSMIPVEGWTVYKAYQGDLSCVVPMTDADKGSYTMQLIVADPIDENTTYGVAVDVENSPIAAVPEARIEFVQIDFVGNEVRNGHNFVQKMEGAFENGKFVYNHDVIKALTEDLKNTINGYQSVPDGIYKPVVKIADAAKNVSEILMPLIFVDMTAPKIK
jgi:hypothetical protein